MKQISVAGIAKGVTTPSKWIVTSTEDPLYNSHFLCALACDTVEEAEEITRAIKESLEGCEEPNAVYYLKPHGSHVVISELLLKNYFDGVVELTTGVNCEVTEDGLIPLYTPTDDEIKFSEEYLGAMPFSAKSKTNIPRVQEAFCFEKLCHEKLRYYQILWLPVDSYQNQEMLAAYGCQDSKTAKLLMECIQDDAKKNLPNNDAEVANTALMKNKGAILLISKKYLEKIYGDPACVRLVNKYAKRGLADKMAEERKAVITATYNSWDKAAMKKTRELKRKREELASKKAPVHKTNQANANNTLANLLKSFSDLQQNRQLLALRSEQWPAFFHEAQRVLGLSSSEVLAAAPLLKPSAVSEVSAQAQNPFRFSAKPYLPPPELPIPHRSTNTVMPLQSERLGSIEEEVPSVHAFTADDFFSMK